MVDEKNHCGQNMHMFDASCTVLVPQVDTTLDRKRYAETVQRLVKAAAVDVCSDAEREKELVKVLDDKNTVVFGTQMMLDVVNHKLTMAQQVLVLQTMWQHKKRSCVLKITHLTGWMSTNLDFASRRAVAGKMSSTGGSFIVYKGDAVPNDVF